MSGPDYPLAWSHERPTRPGWYWLRYEGPAEIVHVEEDVRGDLRGGGGVWTVAGAPEDVEWAGPIPLPHEPASNG